MLYFNMANILNYCKPCMGNIMKNPCNVWQPKSSVDSSRGSNTWLLLKGQVLSYDLLKLGEKRQILLHGKNRAVFHIAGFFPPALYYETAVISCWRGILFFMLVPWGKDIFFSYMFVSCPAVKCSQLPVYLDDATWLILKTSSILPQYLAL